MPVENDQINAKGGILLPSGRSPLESGTPDPDGAFVLPYGAAPYQTRNRFPTAMSAYNTLRVLRANTADVNLLILSDSTALQQVPWPLTLGTRLGQQHQQFTVLYHKWNGETLAFNTATTVQTGTGTGNAGGPFTLHIWNFSFSGKTSQYYIGSNWATLLSSFTSEELPNCVIIGQGWNEPSSSTQIHSRITSLAEFCRREFPSADILLEAENVGVSPVANPLINIGNSIQIQDICRACGYGFVDVCDWFLNLESSPAPWSLTTRGLSYFVQTDGIHPSSADLIGYSPLNPVTGNATSATVDLYGNPTGGTFAITFGGQTTGALAWNAPLATVQTALIALSSVGAGNMVVTGVPGVRYICTPSGTALGKQMTVTGSLTGGSSPYVATCGLDANGEIFGMEIVSELMMDHFQWGTGVQPRTSQQSSYSEPTECLLLDPAFQTWDGVSALPDGWQVSGAGTLSKDTTHFESGNFALKIAGTGASSGIYLYKDLDSTWLPVLRGKAVGMAVRLYVPEGSPAGVGRVGLDSSTGGSPTVQSNTTEGQGAFRWAFQYITVIASATRVRLLIYLMDSTVASGEQSITVDRVCPARGWLPRDINLISTMGPVINEVLQPFTSFPAQTTTTPVTIAAGALYTAGTGSGTYNIPSSITTGQVFGVQRGSLTTAITITAPAGISINGGSAGNSVILTGTGATAHNGFIWLLATSSTTLITVGAVGTDFNAGWVYGGKAIANAGVDVKTLGQGFSVVEGSNSKQGTATLAAGTVTVANTSVTASSRIFLTVQSLGTVVTPSALAVTARSAGTSFTITASQVTDTSVVAYEIFEPG